MLGRLPRRPPPVALPQLAARAAIGRPAVASTCRMSAATNAVASADPLSFDPGLEGAIKAVHGNKTKAVVYVTGGACQVSGLACAACSDHGWAGEAAAGGLLLSDA